MLFFNTLIKIKNTFWKKRRHSFGLLFICPLRLNSHVIIFLMLISYVFMHKYVHMYVETRGQLQISFVKIGLPLVFWQLCHCDFVYTECTVVCLAGVHLRMCTETRARCQVSASNTPCLTPGRWCLFLSQQTPVVLVSIPHSVGVTVVHGHDQLSTWVLRIQTQGLVFT